MRDVLLVHGRAAKALGRFALCSLIFSVFLRAGPAARADSFWVALNDQPAVSNANATAYQPPAVGSPSSGPLRNLSAGTNLPVSVSITSVTNGGEILPAPTMGAPGAGTPAYSVFNSLVDWNGGFRFTNASVSYAFSGLNPGKRYRFTATGIRGVAPGDNANMGYNSNRWTRAELTGALRYTAAHSANVMTSNQYPADLTGSQAAWNAAVNLSGDLIDWSNIAPAPDGTFAITTVRYTGPFPGGNAANGFTSYGFSVFRLEESPIVPQAAITAPAEGAVVIAPTNLTIAAAVSEFSGTVTNVAFYAGTTRLGNATSTPFACVWSNMAVGGCALRAVATDNTGISATSAVVHVTVSYTAIPLGVTNTFEALPTVSQWSTLSIGGAGADYQTEADLLTAIQSLEASAINQALGESAVTPPASAGLAQWNLAGGYLQTRPTANGATLLMATLINTLPYTLAGLDISYEAMVSDSPATPEEIDGPRCFYSLTGAAGSWVPVPELSTNQSGGLSATLNPGAWAPGTLLYVLWADDNGNGIVDGSWAYDNLKVAGPMVRITRPGNNAQLGLPGSVAITAEASDFRNPVTNVAFYVDANKLADDATSPYGAVWANASAGQYVLTAVARDNAGFSVTSAPVSITISHVAIPLGVAYAFDSLPLASDWTTLSIAGSGPGLMTEAALEAALQTNAASVINQTLGQSATLPPATASLAQWNSSGLFVETRPTGNAATLLMATVINTSSDTLSTLDVDCDLAYAADPLDEEINGPRCFFSLTGAANSWMPVPEFSTAQTGTRTAELNLGSWPNGSRLYLLWADDNGAPGTDGAWTWDNFKAGGPRVKITSPTHNALLGLPDSIGINARVSGFTGTVTNVAFFIDGTGMWNDTNSPYSAVWSNATPGQYVLTAIASDNAGVSATSPPVTLRLQTNTAPAVALTSPLDAAVFEAPANLSLTAAASDLDGSVTNMAFFANGVKIGQDSTSPYDCAWTNVAAATYDLMAVAYDNLGVLATSSVVRIYVKAPTPPTVASFVPPPGVVSNLTSLTVIFSEPVDGVDAADLLINAVAAASRTGSNTTYTFSFSQPPEGLVTVRWAPSHGIVNRLASPQPFDGTLPNEIADYTLIDTVPPVVSVINPTPGATVSGLTQVEVSFSEAVAGVTDNALVINGVPAGAVSGSLAGPYRFTFAQPANGLVQLTLGTNGGIHDVAAALNPFGGATWSYALDTNATGVVLSEIMYHPSSENLLEEYIELHNTGAATVHLAGWQLTAGVRFTFPNVSIPAGGFLVVAADVATFTNKYPGVTNVVGNWVGFLANNSEAIHLDNAQGQRVDSVRYADDGDWAIRRRGALERGHRGWVWFSEHDGRGKSLELINPLLPNDHGQNWAASLTTNGTPGRANSVLDTNLAPLILEAAIPQPSPGPPTRCS